MNHLVEVLQSFSDAYILSPVVLTMGIGEDSAGAAFANLHLR